MKNWKISFGKIVDQDDKVICGLPKRENNDAAHLIASAPELLDSLKDLENTLSCKPYDRDEQKLLVIARAAIAKAKGLNNMKTIQHTPGPWAVAGESYNDHEAYVIEAGGRTICWTASSLDDAGIEVITAEDDANADLLAAAPDLLSALESLLEDHKRMFPEAHPHSVIKWAECAEVSRAQKAISKAKGESK
jgi:hypothetical protein